MSVRIYARNCSVCEISKKDANEFIKMYHKQGGVSSQICFGLFYNNELVQVETFGFDRYTHGKYEYELYRECSKKDHYILGGKSKLLKAFIRKYNPHNIISYSSLEEGFDGHSYIDCGFTFLHKQSGSYHYEINGKKITRNSMMKNDKLEAEGRLSPIHATLINLGKESVFSRDKTEKEMAEEAGLTKFEEKGNLVYELLIRPYTGIIYKTTNTVNGKIYVGQHKDTDDIYIGSGTLLYRAIQKYGRDKFVRETLESFTENYSSVFINKLNEAEKKWIKYYNSTELSIGYNIDSGGNGHIGYAKAGPELRTKLSESHRGILHTEDEKKRIGDANKGKRRTPEQKAKISAACKGRPSNNKGTHYSEDIKQHMRAGHSNISAETRAKIGDKSRGRLHSDEDKLKISEASKNNWQNPEYRQKVIEAVNNANTPEVNNKRREASKKLWQNPEYRDKCKIVMTSELKEKIGEASKNNWKNPEYRKKFSENRTGAGCKTYIYEGKEYNGRQAICDECGLTIKQVKTRIKNGIITVK